MTGSLYLSCEKCRFVFESARAMDRCPDCGGGPVRPASAAERAEYAANRRRYGPMPAYGTDPPGAKRLGGRPVPLPAMRT